MNFVEQVHTEVVKRERLGSEYRENAHAHIESLKAALDTIPEQYRMSAVFEIATWEDRDGLHEHSMRISYDRPPTEAEIKDRIEAERERVAEEIDWFHERAKDILQEAERCGYRIPEELWPFKAEQPGKSRSD